MISKHNFELVRVILDYQIKERGIYKNHVRRDWDTFSGWKKRGKSIQKGSRGFSVEIIHPYIKSKKNNRTSFGFFYKKTYLFFVNQTC